MSERELEERNGQVIRGPLLTTYILFTMLQRISLVAFCGLWHIILTNKGKTGQVASGAVLISPLRKPCRQHDVQLGLSSCSLSMIVGPLHLSITS